MTVDDFIRKAVGIPWGARCCDWQSMDCWGLVLLYFRHVLDIELPFIDGYQYQEAEMSALYVEPELQKKRWLQVDSTIGNDVVFIAYHKGEPVHVGIVIDQHYVLHTNGNSKHGQVQYNRLETLQRAYQKIEFYRYAG